MRKKYKLNESTGEFKIIDLPDNRKNIILSDGTDVAKKIGVSGIDKVTKYTVNNKGIYVCETVPKTYKWIVSDSNGGKFFNKELDNVYVHDKNGIKVARCTGKSINQRAEALLDTDLNIISLGWHSFITNAFDHFLIVTDVDKDESENVVDIKQQKYVLKKWYTSVEEIRVGVELFDCEVEDMMHVIADTEGNVITETPIRRIESLTNLYYPDSFGGEDVKLNFMLTTDEYGYHQTLYTGENGKLKEYPVTENGEVIEVGQYEINNEFGDDIFTINTMQGINWISFDGKLALEKGANEIVDEISISPGTRESAYIIKRGEKYNFVGSLSMVPMFKENEWIDDFQFIDHDLIAIKRGNKCNLIIKDNMPALALKEWSDDILTSENIVFVKYGDKTYLFLEGKLFKCDEYTLGKYDIIFIHDESSNKWNALYFNSNNPEFILDEGVDAIYDVDSYFPIVEKDGKFAFFSTESEEIVPNTKEYSVNLKTGKTYQSGVKYMWYDDVDPFDDKTFDDSEEYTFTVHNNGKTFNVDIYGNKQE